MMRWLIAGLMLQQFQLRIFFSLSIYHLLCLHMLAAAQWEGKQSKKVEILLAIHDGKKTEEKTTKR